MPSIVGRTRYGPDGGYASSAALASMVNATV